MNRLIACFLAFLVAMSGFAQFPPGPAGVTKTTATKAFSPLVEAPAMTSVAIPSGLNWDSTNFAVFPKIGPVQAGNNLGQFGSGTFSYLNNPDYLAAALSGNVFYADISRSDNSGAGTSWATAERSIKAAVDDLNAAGPGIIYVKGGGSVYDRNNNFSAGTSTNVPTQHVIFIASGGRVVVSTRDFDLTGWALDGTYTNCSLHSGTLANAPSRVLDLSRRVNGLFPDLNQASSIANCNATPWTWFYNSGTSKLYINRGDGQTVTLGSLGNTAILRQQSNLVFSGSTQKSIMLVGETANDGFDIEGAASSTSTSVFNYTSSASRVSGKTLIYAENCSFRYGGFLNGAQTNNNGVGVNNYTGLACFKNCDASGNGTDGFNFHDTLGYGASALTLNCTGNWNGIPNQRSCNGWTSHEGVIGIDIGGKYRFNAGYNVHAIDQTRTLLIGTIASDSRGDRIYGGSFFGGAIRVDGTTANGSIAEMWCYGTRAEPTFANSIAYQATGTATMHQMNIVDVGGVSVTQNTATIDTYDLPSSGLLLLSPETLGITLGMAFWA